MDRISQLCRHLQKCRIFADVACDHGYCAEYMLKKNLCESAIISDISEKSLEKAKNLLSEYIKEGKCGYFCCDGLEAIQPIPDLVLIAGIGGEEIVKILKNAYIPQNFVFQPMKNAETLRMFLLEENCNIEADDIFTDGKNYYFIIKGSKKGDKNNYSPAQIAYGRDSLKNHILKDYLKTELEKKRGYLTRPMSQNSRTGLEQTIKFMQEVLDGGTK